MLLCVRLVCMYSDVFRYTFRRTGCAYHTSNMCRFQLSREIHICHADKSDCCIYRTDKIQSARSSKVETHNLQPCHHSCGRHSFGNLGRNNFPKMWEPCEIMCAPCGQLLPLLAVWASSNDTATAVGGGTRWVVVLSCTGVSRSALYVVHLGFVPTRDGRSPHPGIVCADAAAVHTYRFPSSRQGSLSLASSFNAP